VTDSQTVNDAEYMTSDLHLAAFLYTENVLLIRIDTRDFGGRFPGGVFVFERSDTLLKLAENWRTETATTNALEFSENISSLKRKVNRATGREKQYIGA